MRKIWNWQMNWIKKGISIKNKENEWASNTQKLNIANDNIRHLNNDINNVTNLLNKTKDEIACFDNNLNKETTTLNQLVSDNTRLNDLIKDRNAHINELNSENDILKKTNAELNCDNIKFNNLLQAYKKHLNLLISQNKKLANEIQSLLCRDSDARNILERDNHLQDVRFENDQIVKGSVDKIQQIYDGPPINERRTNINRSYSIDRNGNKGIMGSSINMNLSQSGMNARGTGINNQGNELIISKESQGEQTQGEEMMDNSD